MDNAILGSETQSSAAALVDFLALLDTPPSRPALRLVKGEQPVSLVSKAVRTIEAAQVPEAVVNPEARRLRQKERSKAIRDLLKSLGIKGVSVTSATGSMCYWTNVRIDGVPHPRVKNWGEHRTHECPVCQRNRAAEDKMHRIILAAFPDLGDRSDSMTDHFDFVYTVDVDRALLSEGE